jgi:hypothetical protein
VGPDIGAAHAPAGDIATAIMDIDSTLRRIHADAGTRSPGPAAEDVAGTQQQARDVLDGYCTVIYLFLTMWRKTAEVSGQDLVTEVIAGVVTRLREMTRNVAPSAIPTMAAMMTAAAMEASPTLWRAQFGDWRPEELAAVQATAVLLAEGVNLAHEDDTAALRMIMGVLEQAEDQP